MRTLPIIPEEKLLKPRRNFSKVTSLVVNHPVEGKPFSEQERFAGTSTHEHRSVTIAAKRSTSSTRCTISNYSMRASPGREFDL